MGVLYIKHLPHILVQKKKKKMLAIASLAFFPFHFFSGSNSLHDFNAPNPSVLFEYLLKTGHRIEILQRLKANISLSFHQDSHAPHTAHTSFFLAVQLPLQSLKRKHTPSPLQGCISHFIRLCPRSRTISQHPQSVFEPAQMRRKTNCNDFRTGRLRASLLGYLAKVGGSLPVPLTHRSFLGLTDITFCYI